MTDPIQGHFDPQKFKKNPTLSFVKLRAYLAVFWSSGGQNDLRSGGHIKKNDHREIIHQMAYSTENPKIFATLNFFSSTEIFF